MLPSSSLFLELGSKEFSGSQISEWQSPLILPSQYPSSSLDKNCEKDFISLSFKKETELFLTYQ